MPHLSRYDIDQLTEAQFESGSRGRVLKNLLGIRSKRAMDELEATRLADATDRAIRRVSANQRFTAADIYQWHKQWLGKIYPWAGEYRQVNISKDGFVFAMAAQVPRLMSEFERKELARFTPCTFDNLENVLEALAITHCELVLIHPFREGNGRLSRLLCQLMALQAGLPLLNFSSIKGKQREAYFAAVRAGMGRDYAPMVEIFRKVVKASS
ncbi:MAG TPA: Fic family protein [Gallionella sp.]|nr:Fic family protein [Gallionella sp.]